MSLERLRAELTALLPRLRRFARALTRNASDADDLVQTALERAFRHAGQLRADAQLSAIAIERDAARAAIIARNAAMLGVPGLEIVQGKLPKLTALGERSRRFERVGEVDCTIER